MPFIGREPVIVPREKPTGPPVFYPTCSDWTCDDDEDWEWIGPEDEDYSAVRREEQIARYHQPRDKWPERLHEERARLSGGDPLWWGKPKP